MEPKRSRKARKKDDKKGVTWKKALISLGLSMAVGGLLILLASILAYITPDPGKWVLPFAIFAAGITYFFAGWIAAKARPDAPLAAGSANGLFLSAVSILLSLFCHKSALALPVWAAVVLHAGMILLALSGAAFYARKRNRPRRKRKLKRRV